MPEVLEASSTPLCEPYISQIATVSTTILSNLEFTSKPVTIITVFNVSISFIFFGKQTAGVPTLS
jgi:hypothetical protein